MKIVPKRGREGSRNHLFVWDPPPVSRRGSGRDSPGNMIGCEEKYIEGPEARYKYFIPKMKEQKD